MLLAEHRKRRTDGWPAWNGKGQPSAFILRMADRMLALPPTRPAKRRPLRSLFAIRPLPYGRGSDQDVRYGARLLQLTG